MGEERGRHPKWPTTPKAPAVPAPSGRLAPPVEEEPWTPARRRTLGTALLVLAAFAAVPYGLRRAGIILRPVPIPSIEIVDARSGRALPATDVAVIFAPRDRRAKGPTRARLVAPDGAGRYVVPGLEPGEPVSLMRELHVFAPGRKPALRVHAAAPKRVTLQPLAGALAPEEEAALRALAALDPAVGRELARLGSGSATAPPPAADRRRESP